MTKAQALSATSPLPKYTRLWRITPHSTGSVNTSEEEGEVGCWLWPCVVCWGRFQQHCSRLCQCASCSSGKSTSWTHYPAFSSPFMWNSKCRRPTSKFYGVDAGFFFAFFFLVWFVWLLFIESASVTEQGKYLPSYKGLGMCQVVHTSTVGLCQNNFVSQCMYLNCILCTVYSNCVCVSLCVFPSKVHPGLWLLDFVGVVHYSDVSGSVLSLSPHTGKRPILRGRRKKGQHICL